MQKIYQGSNLNNDLCCQYKDVIVFIDGNRCIGLNYKLKTIGELYCVDEKLNINKVILRDSYLLLISDTDDEYNYYCYSFSNKNIRPINIDEYVLLLEDIDEMVYTSLNITDDDDYNLDNLRSAFPINSFFNTKGSACTDHPGNTRKGNYCITYGSCYQCYGYAKKAMDVYSHESSWDSDSSEHFGSLSYSVTANNLISLLNNTVERGSHIRYRHIATSSSSYTYNHSVFYISNNGVRTHTFEANYGGADYQIEEFNYSISYLVSEYSYVIEYDTHKYDSSSTFTMYNNIYHKHNCANNNCEAFVYEKHEMNKAIPFEGNALKHLYVCSYCDYPSTTYRNHSFNIVGGVTICSECGYTRRNT